MPPHQRRQINTQQHALIDHQPAVPSTVQVTVKVFGS